MEKPWLKQYPPEIPAAVEILETPLFHLLDEGAKKHSMLTALVLFGAMLIHF